MALLKISALRKDFGGLRAVSDLSFELRKGEILGLIGPNGAGKTTVFNLITGFIPPTEGQVLLEGQSLIGLRPYAIVKKGIARTFQIVKPFRNLSVLENVTLATFLHEPSRSIAETKAMVTLRRVALAEKHAVNASDLTLAEQKRLEIARALATDPKILFLDEPMGGLNPTEVESACALVQRIRQDGITVILVEHHMKAIMAVSDRVIVLNYGVKIADGAPQDVVRNRDVISAYLGEQGP
jgi:branched-chain amino acid transport system ATP-binding protein